MRFALSIVLACGSITAPPLFGRTVDAQRQRVDSAQSANTRALDTVRVRARRSTGDYAAEQSSSITRTDLPLRDTPRSVTVVTHRLIADQSMQQMADVARYVPGVSMASGEGHRDAPTIRGNSTTADFFLDGVRDDAQYLRDFYNVERVEVLKGSEALLFGRGGGGGIINRVTRQAGWLPSSSLTLEGGSFDHKRATSDVGQSFDGHLAGRLTSMYERSGGFRDAASLTRFGANPTLAIMAGPRTLVRLGYEIFDDERRVDRGIPSYHGRPIAIARSTFFGNPSINHSNLRADIGSASIDHRTDGGWTLRNRTTWEAYDKFYQNTLPGAVDATGTRVSLSAYNHSIGRHNLIDVADVTRSFSTGIVHHTLLVGTDISRQTTDQVRNTGYYGDTSATYLALLSAPTINTPVRFRPSASDANNATTANDGSLYVQDQISLSPALLMLAGVRAERFAIDYLNNRNGQTLDRTDDFVSPRLGVVVKPGTELSVYASYGVSHLPSSGDQFTSLTVTTATLEPERFTSREIGAKWNPLPELALNAALYRLDRTNTSAPDPVNPGQVVQTGAQRTNGWEAGITGSPIRVWQIAGGIAQQDAKIVSTTSSAKAGATVPLVPHTTASLWNRVQITSRLGAGLGVVHQTNSYAAIDNTVIMPGFTRVDAAFYADARRGLRFQVNVENTFDETYYATTQGNNNIMPGAPRTVRLSVTASR